MRALLAGVVVAAGCGEKSPGDTDGAETTAASGSSSGGASMSETGEGTPTTGVGSTSAGSDSASATGTGSTGSTGETGESGTSGGLACAIEDQACALAGSLGAFMDCGVVDPWNDGVEAWQAAHDCALAAAQAQQAFKLITVLQGIDSDVAEAFVGVAARSYALSRLFLDSDPCGGGGCGPVISVSGCAGLTAVADCAVEPGNVCLSCDGVGEATQLCGPA